jgi:hypothetical protein
LTVGPAAGEKSVVVSLAVANPMSAKVNAKQRHEYDVNFAWLDFIFMPRFTDLPAVMNELSVGPVEKAFELFGFVIYARDDGIYGRKVTPHAFKYRPGINLA